MAVEASTVTAISSVLAATAAVASATEKRPGVKAPALEKPTTMPSPDDEAAKRARMKMASGLQERQGRQSTILSDPVSADLLGG